MGTFHDDKGELHGITIVVIAADVVTVGRCDTIDEQDIILLDADTHREGEGGQTNEEWLQRVASFGIWKKHERLVLSRAGVTSVNPLGDLIRRGVAPRQYR